MKKLATFILITAIILTFGGCASASMDRDMGYLSFDGAATESWDSKNEFAIEEPVIEEMPEAEKVPVAFDSLADYDSPSPNQYQGNRKLIRTFDLEVETLEFEDFITSLKAEVSALGGYIEGSSISGNSYNYDSNRDAYFNCRLPCEKVDEFVNTIGGLGNITYSHENADDITLDYVDTEARIKSLQTEYDRLLELLAEAENIDTIILLEQRITEVRYELESYQSRLRTYDNKVDYSTVNLNIHEVKRVTATENETVWQRIGNDFSDNIYDIWVNAQDFFVWLVASLPYFLIWGIIIAAVVLIIRFIFNKNPRYREKRAARKAAKEYKKAQKLAGNNASAPEAEAIPEEK